MAVGRANITLWKIRGVLNQQIEHQCAQKVCTDAHTYTHQSQINIYNIDNI